MYSTFVTRSRTQSTSLQGVSQIGGSHVPYAQQTLSDEICRPASCKIVSMKRNDQCYVIHEILISQKDMVWPGISFPEPKFVTLGAEVCSGSPRLYPAVYMLYRYRLYHHSTPYYYVTFLRYSIIVSQK